MSSRWGKRKLQLLQANKDEDKVISRLEKMLGMKKKRRKKKEGQREKIHSSFAEDGLDYILGALDHPGDEAEDDDLNEDLPKCTAYRKEIMSFKKHEAVTPPKKNKHTAKSEGDEAPSSGNSSSDYSEAEEWSDSNSEGIVDENLDDDDESDCSGGVKSDKGNCETPEDDDDKEGCRDKRKKPKIWEDIYGRLRDEEGNILPNNISPSQVYVPPHERERQEPVSEDRKEDLSRIRKQLKGLINRLSESNMGRIISEVEEMYMKNSRNDMNETLMMILFDVLLSPVSVPPRFAMEQAMFVALLHGNIGSEIGAFFLQSLASKLDGLLKLGDSGEQGKQCNNLVTFLCHLYNFKVTHCMLIFDLLRLLVEPFREVDIELILLIIKDAGFALRKDDPLAFKEVLLAVQSKAAASKPGQNQSRVNFMLDILIELRNNNMEKLKKLLSYDPSIIEHLKKTLRGLIRKGSYIQSLSITYDDLLKADQQGRWWVVGSAWSERPTEQTSDVKTDCVPRVDHSDSERVLKLAQKLHINTEIRRIVFSVIMNSQDYVEAFESLLRMKVKHQQEKEIISVLLHCSLQEKNFNPYYAFLITKFCKYDRRFRGYLKFSLWDKFKELEKLKPLQRNCLTSLLVHLLTAESLDLSVLKVIQFSEMNRATVQFFRKVLIAVLQQESEEVCYKVFQHIAANSNLHLLRESLRLFMHHFILHKKSQWDSTDSEKLTQRVKLAEDALNSAKHAFKL